MYKLGDILEYSYARPTGTLKNPSWKRETVQALVVYVVRQKPGVYKMRDITPGPLGESTFTITDSSYGYRKVGNIWEGSSAFKSR